jgi:RHS repeat-associated protein
MDGLRAKSVKTVGSSSTVHLYDGQMPVCEQEFEDGVLKQTRIHLLGARGIEGIITVPATGAASLNWLLYDGHGNMVRTMNTAFALSGFQWRGVWGERTNSTPGRGYCANLGHPEDETGLVYMRARYYEPTTGRFISEDPARDGGNWYLYADGDPVGKVDFTGKFTWAVLFMLATAALGFWAGIISGYVWGANQVENFPINGTNGRLLQSSAYPVTFLLMLGLFGTLWRSPEGTIPRLGLLKLGIAFAIGFIFGFVFGALLAASDYRESKE